MGILDRIRSSPLVSYEVPVANLHVRIQATENLPDEARAIALKHWEQIESQVVRNPSFKQSSFPVSVGDEAPPLAKIMADAAAQTGVGPMVGLPGALVEAIAIDLAMLSREVIVSAEGDTFVISDRPRTFVVERSPHPGGGGIGIRVSDGGRYAFYASTGRLQVDPAIGRARAVAVLAEHGAVADTVASAMGNAMHRPEDVHRTFEICRKVEGVRGALLLIGSRIAVWGDIEVVAPRPNP